MTTSCVHPPAETCPSCWCSECDDYIVNVGEGPTYSADEHRREHVADREEREDEKGGLDPDEAGEPRWGRPVTFTKRTT